MPENMSCGFIPSKITLRLDSDEKFLSFDFGKIICGLPVSKELNLSNHFLKKTLPEILQTTFVSLVKDFSIENQEDEFLLYVEWDALRSAIGNYLNVNDETIDKERCHVVSVNHDEEGITIEQILLPPKEMPNVPISE